MSFGQQPWGGPNNGNAGNGQQPQGYYQNHNQQPYGSPYNPQYHMDPNGAAINTQATYSYERAQHVSMTRAYGEMTIGLLLTAVVAIVTQMSGLYMRFLVATGGMGMWILAIIQIVLAIALGARVMKMSTGTARAMFYIYAALMGVTLSTIFGAFDLTTIGISLALCAGFFFALTMFGLTTKGNMLKAGPILLIALVVLIIAEVIIMLFFPGQTALMVISALGLILFAGMTIYDAQFTRAIFAQYASQGPEMIKKISILCALNLYLDFVNMFLYILQLFGLSRD